jgi:hypothetical protein
MEDAGEARVGLIVIERVEGSTDIYQGMGHVAAFVEIGEERWVRGFWPIPPEGMAIEEFRALLWERTFPGQILNDVRMFDYTEAIIRSWDVPESAARHMLGQIERVGPTALQYGLRPGRLGGENCVTWAAKLVEEATGRVLLHPSGYSAWRGAIPRGGVEYTLRSAGTVSWFAEALRKMP